MTSAGPCPCGSGASFGDCCEPIHHDHRRADTAEALMRSRYTAYVTGAVDHLARSWHPGTRPSTIATDPQRAWQSLEVIATERGRALDAGGVVEFVATSTIDGQEHRLHERSRFERVAGAWVYVDGDLLP